MTNWRTVLGICVLALLAGACAPRPISFGAASISRGLGEASLARGSLEASSLPREVLSAQREMSLVARDMAFAPEVNHLQYMAREIAFPPEINVLSTKSSTVPIGTTNVEISPIKAGVDVSPAKSSLDISPIKPSIRRAQPKIVNELKAARNVLSLEKADAIIKHNLAKSMQTAAEKPDSGIKFELLTGKLKFERSKKLGRINVTGGEINVYKISAAVAGAVMVCDVLNNNTPKKVGRYIDCVKKAIKQISKLMVEEIKGQTKYGYRKEEM